MKIFSRRRIVGAFAASIAALAATAQDASSFPEADLEPVRETTLAERTE